MDLHTGDPVWLECERTRAAIPAPPLEHDLSCDVAVVGGGITGALVCDRLVSHGVDAVLLDSRPFGVGSTLASTGMLVPEPDTPIAELARRLGDTAAARVLELGECAVNDLVELGRELGGDAVVQRRPALYVASTRRDAQGLEEELAVRARLGHRAERMTQADLAEAGFSLTAPLAMRTRTAAEVNAYALCRTALRRCTQRGVRAFTPVTVVSREPDAFGVRLRTAEGPSVRARHAILATGYEAHEQLHTDLGTLHSTWVIATEPLAAMPAPGWPERTLIWETARPYVYVRAAGDRLIAGGLDEPCEQAHQDEQKILAKAATLAERVAAMFPDIAFSNVTAWAGVFGESRDGLPYIGRATPHTPVHAALGYGGNGITFAMMAARILCDAVRGVENPDAALFRFDRAESDASSGRS